MNLPTIGTGILSLAEFIGIPRARLKWLFDTAPLRATVKRYFDADLLHRNIQEGRVHALALVATASNGRTTVFVEAKPGVQLPDTDEDRAIDYVASTIEPEHVLASAAIPILFPSILVKHPDKARGWYRDGLVRLNAPIKPALALDAKQLALVASDPDTYASSSATPGPVEEKEGPDIADAGSQLLHAVLADHMVEDIRKLRTVNQLVNQLRKHGFEVTIERDNKPPYEFIDHIFVGPNELGVIGDMAESHFKEKCYDSWWRFWSPFAPLGRLLGSNSKSRGELLSWLFFESEFMQELINRGKTDAHDRLQEAQKLGVFPFDKGV
jgi:NTE family protein